MCTNFLLAVPTDPGTPGGLVTYASARTIELSGVVNFSLYLIPRGQNFPLENPPPPVPNPLKWTNQYGFVAIADPDAFAKFPCFVDGLNERGLSLGALWLPGTVYPPSGPNPNVFYSDFGAWVLGNFATVAEVEMGLNKISVVNPPVPVPIQPNNPGPAYLVLHFIVTDPTGASLIVEFVDSKMKVYSPAYDNGATSDGVLTNAPPYDWQRHNLANYIHLNVVGPATSSAPNAPAVGSGLLGMPGDPMSASRFVRAATMRKGFSLLPGDGSGWLPAPGGLPGKGYSGSAQTIVNIAMQLIQVVMATPYGTLLAPGKGSGSAPQVGDWTMWAVVRDHTHRKYYFTTAFNGIMRGVDLNAINFDTQPPYLTIPLLPSSSAWYEDATKQFS